MRPLALRPSLKPPPLLRRPILPTAYLRAASSSSSSKKRSGANQDEPFIAPGSENHHDLPSFLSYATRVDLAPDRTVFVGTHYEYTVAATLKRLGFALTRTGRASDFGIDLLGRWTLPIPSSSTKKKDKEAAAAAAAAAETAAAPANGLRVLVQCKASNAILNPKHVRELEGAFTGAPARWREADFLGLLATTKKATRGVMEALGRSRWPMGFLKVDPDGRVEQFLWNASAKARGLEGLGVTLRYMVDQRDTGGAVKSDIALTWQGRPLPYVALSGEAEALPALQMEPAEIVGEDEADAEAEPVEEKAERKKRKPRKKKEEPEAASDPQMEAADTAESVSDAASENVEEKPEKKKRKPRKKKEESEAAPESKAESAETADANMSDAASAQVEEQPAKKKRGKPRKNKAEENTSDAASEHVEEEPAQKKRGRPKKRREVEEA